MGGGEGEAAAWPIVHRVSYSPQVKVGDTRSYLRPWRLAGEGEAEGEEGMAIGGGRGP